MADDLDGRLGRTGIGITFDVCDYYRTVRDEYLDQREASAVNSFEDDIYERDDNGDMIYDQSSDYEGKATWPIETNYDVYDPQLDQFGWL